MSDIIQLLPDHVANQIAAGEVVQRPASVVKELLENAIDAKATSIQLIIKDAGKTLVQVIDNGTGMSVTDARLSFERHATSKISTAEDLFQLNTKGFRGEALASIAAIAHVEMKTKRDLDELGTILKIEGSKIIEQEVVVTPRGTSIAVKNLFFNIPARRNFLKSDQVEMRHIVDEFQRVALVHPDISFTLYSNGSEMFVLPISNHRQRIVNVFGSKTNEKLVPVNEATEILNITGFVTKPEFSKKSSKEQFFFVNDRFIKSSYLNHAITAAFDGLLKDRSYPGYFLYLNVDPKTIDINIHPTKTEIKFDNEHDLYAIIKSTIKHSLGQFQIAPILDFNRDSSMDTPYEYKNKKIGTPIIEVDSSFNPFLDEKTASRVPSSNSFSSLQVPKKNSDDWEGLYVGLESQISSDSTSGSIVEFESEEVTGSFFDESEVFQEQITLQVQNKYIVSKIKSGIVVIHQHRAHERILYEEFLKHITINQAVSQQLLFPVKVSVTKDELLNFNTVKEVLENTGFVFSNVSNEEIEVTGIPSAIEDSKAPIIIHDLLSSMDNALEVNELHANLVARSMAKSIAIKSGKSLTRLEQEDIVNRLFACKEPTVSPINKAIFITYSTNDFDKKLL
jgi:DNA mismatch repair protein MutL